MVLGEYKECVPSALDVVPPSTFGLGPNYISGFGHTFFIFTQNHQIFLIYAIYEEGCQERYQERNCSGTVLFHDRSFCSMNTAGSLILMKLVTDSLFVTLNKSRVPRPLLNLSRHYLWIMPWILRLVSIYYLSL